MTKQCSPMSDPARSRKPRGQGPSRRPEILRAAQRLFLEEGYERTTMRRLASAVGVSATALYVYFPDKDAILHAIAEITFNDMLARLEATQALPLPPLERFRAGLRGYVEFGLSRPDEYRLTFLAKAMLPSAPGQHVLDCRRFEAKSRSFAILERGIVELMDAGVFRHAPPTLAAEAVWACLHGVTALLLDLPAQVQTAPDTLMESVLDLALRGLQEPQPASAPYTRGTGGG
jgi:AcrR family transcriptional regulator